MGLRVSGQGMRGCVQVFGVKGLGLVFQRCFDLMLANTLREQQYYEIVAVAAAAVAGAASAGATVTTRTTY